MSARNVLVRSLRIVSTPTTTNTIATRSFVSSSVEYRTATETIKDAAKTVDRTISQAAIKGLEGVEKVNEVAKDASEKVGIKLESSPDPLDVGPVSEKAGVKAEKAEVKAEKVKEGAKAGVRDAADKVKDAAT
jgi:hypothetical protein